MRVIVSEVEALKITHPFFKGGYVCISPEVIHFVDKIFPESNGLAGIVKAAHREGILPYSAGNNVSGNSIVNVGVKKPYERKIKKLLELDGDVTIIAAPLKHRDFKDLADIFKMGYTLHMHS